MTHRRLAVVAATGLALTTVILYSIRHPRMPAFEPRDAMSVATQATTPCVTPPRLSHHVAPQTTLVYRYVGAWSETAQTCSARAFQTWNTYLDTTPLGIRWAPVRDTPRTGLVSRVSVIATPLAGTTGGAITEVTRTTDGALMTVGILVTTNTSVVSSCLGYYKVMLHEIGHVLGLSHPRGDNQSSIMNDLAGVNDVNLALPVAPTACDLSQVVAASQQTP